MYTIILDREIKAPREVVWGVIMDGKAYSEWNPFVLDCDSTFEVGSPIKMEVELGMVKPLTQTELITQNTEGELIEYQYRMPLGSVRSIRQHILTSVDDNTTHYRSHFQLQGWLAPLVKLMQGKALNTGFTGMTDGIVKRAESMAS